MKAALYYLIFGVLSGMAQAEVVAIPHPAVELPRDKTVVWSPTFQAAWDALNTQKGGLPERIEPPSKTVSLLDTCRWDPAAVMPEVGWKAWGGKATEEFLEQVNREAAAITGEKEGPFKLGGTCGGLASFGLLHREVFFEKPLHRSTRSALEFRAAGETFSASFFGTAGDVSGNFSDTIRVLFYQPEKRSYVISLRCATTDESVILYLPPALEDMATACEAVGQWITAYKRDPSKYGAADNPGLHRDDELKIPYLSLDAKSGFPEVTGQLRFYKGEEMPWRIFRADQITRFKLHEKGAKVRVEASIEMMPFGEPPPPPPTVPRKFIFDRPFFVFLWREKAEWPYFGAWIGDTSALKPFVAE